MKIKFIVFLLLVFSLIGLSSCDNETNTPTPPVTGQTNYYVDFTVDSLNVYIYDTAILPLDTDAVVMPAVAVIQFKKSLTVLELVNDVLCVVVPFTTVTY